MAAIEDDRTPGPRAASGRRAAVLAELRRAPDGVAELAARLGVHPNTVRLHVAALAADGLVEEAPATTARGRGRPSLVYRATRRMPQGPDRYRELAGALLEALVHDDDAGTRALDAGRAWGARIARARGTAAPDPGPRAVAPPDGLPALLTVLDDVGFAPERAPHGIALRQCPFLDLVEAPRMVVCRVHLGLMQGALATWRSGAEVDRLEPFVEPDLCLAHVRRAGRRRHEAAS
ncbi:helix-turn-helix transcriptional regulator [Cellulomonas alba]|uniref:MarR family transcriptional regulator n=1 Tax=Cellulomonas alba TaxID=3053467 RepID=A0ABT7SDA4_9CELL|nr:helix-turn-helix domain-containing protein [Cellulomonas alba]MDM7854150.1 MarR family transcriptional regulator [Cellulomonas alba]